MGFGIKVLIEGDRACFTRPEMKSERVSYDVRVCKIVCVSPLKGQRLRRRSSPAQGAGHATMAAAWPAADWRRP